MRIILRLLLIAAFAGVLAVVPRSSVFAAQTVNIPALNPDPTTILDPEELPTLQCDATGSGTICRANEAFPVVNPPRSCGTFSIVSSGSVYVADTLRYDPSGNLVEWTTRVDIELTITDLATGQTANYRSTQNNKTTFAEPGNLDTGRLVVSGVWPSMVTMPGQGIIWQNTGHVIVYPDGTITAYGPHMAFEGFRLTPILCAAFAA